MFFSLSSLLAPLALTALAMDAPLSADEEVLAEHCLAHGGSTDECACGIEMARELMTPREVSLMAEVGPSLSGETDLGEALIKAPEIAAEKGFSPSEFAGVMQKVFEYAGVVEERCDDTGLVPDPDGATGDEATPGVGVPSE